MATARWSRNDCSICLEPFRGRNPKFLPCYHTFCVQCLNQLADRAREESRTVLWRVGGGISITCPACRKTTPVPPDGIESLQTNFYIDDAIYCDLCDEGHRAECACSTCPSKFCRGCRSVHEEICDMAVVYEINDSAPDGSSSAGDLAAKVKVVSAKMQRLEKLTEVTPMLTRDLNAAQKISTKIRSEVSSLQSEQTSLKGRLSSLDSRHQNLTLNVDDLRTTNQLLRSDFNKQKEELQNLQRNHASLEWRFTQHDHNGLESKHENLRNYHDKLSDKFEEHVGPKYNYTHNWSTTDVSDHAKLKERIQSLESKINEKCEANERNRWNLEKNMNEKIASNWNCSVELIIGLLFLASVVNCIVLAHFHDKFVRLR